MDRIRLEIRVNDELQPDLRDLVDVMNRLTVIPPDFEGKKKLQKWYFLRIQIIIGSIQIKLAYLTLFIRLATFQSMSASSEIDNEQARDFLLDLV